MNLPHACAIAAFALLPPAGLAATATCLASFEGIEEPLVRYTPATGAFRPDDFVNITDRGDGVLRMALRYRSDEWDGDRDTQNKDRQRAEVKGLGRHQKHGENFEYAFTWRSSPGFRGASRFCHIFQLKSTNGDSGAPLVTVSIEEGQQRGTVRLWSGPAKQPVTVRGFTWAPRTWQTVRLRIRTSPAADGEVLASVDGDEFQGLRSVAVHRPGASDYRPKWGLYRGANPGLSLGDDYIEHKDVAAQKAGGPPVPNDLETAARKQAPDSPAKALAWLEAQPASPSRAAALATLTCEWAGRGPRVCRETLPDRRPRGCAAARLQPLGRPGSRRRPALGGGPRPAGGARRPALVFRDRLDPALRRARAGAGGRGVDRRPATARAGPRTHRAHLGAARARGGRPLHGSLPGPDRGAEGGDRREDPAVGSANM